MLQIAGRVKFYGEEKYRTVYAYRVDDYGNITHVCIELDPNNTTWEPIIECEKTSFQVTHSTK